MDKKTPQIRFEGFTEDWEQRKLGEYIEDYIEKTTILNQYPVLTSSQQQGIVLQEEYFADRQVTTQDNIGYYVLPRGYFTYRSRSDNGIFKFNRNDIIDKGIISYFYPVFKIINGDSDFFLYLLNSTTKKQVMLEAEGTGQKVLSLKKFKNINISVTSINEQSQIGSFFNQIDDTIALHQQKLKKLQQVKKAMLQKMFPKNGSNVPEIRFAGFTNSWEQHKLEKLVDRIKSYSLSREVETDEYTGVKYIHYGDIHTKVADIIVASSLLPNIRSGNYELLDKGDIVLADASENYQGIAMPAVVTISPSYNLVAGLHTIALRPSSADAMFLYYLFHSSNFRKYGYRIGTGMKVFGISATNVLNFESKFPSVNEQEKIGKLLKKIDDTITLQEKQLALLQRLKTAYLQKMFV